MRTILCLFLSASTLLATAGETIDNPWAAIGEKAGVFSLLAGVLWWLFVRYLPRLIDNHKEEIKALVDENRASREMYERHTTELMKRTNINCPLVKPPTEGPQ